MWKIRGTEYSCGESKSFLALDTQSRSHSRIINLDRRLRNTVFRHLANIVSLWYVYPKTFLRARNFVSRACLLRPLGSSFPAGGLSRSSRVHRSITLYFSEHTLHRVDKASQLSLAIVICVRSHSSPHLVPPALSLQLMRIRFQRIPQMITAAVDLKII